MFYKATSGDAELISFTNPASQKEIPSVLVSTLPHKTCLRFWEFRLHNVIHTDGVQPKKDVAKHADIKLYRRSQQRYDSVTVKVRWARGWVKTFSRLKGLERSSLGWIPGREGEGRGCQTTAKHTHTYIHRRTHRNRQVSSRVAELPLHTGQACCCWSSEGESLLKTPHPRHALTPTGDTREWGGIGGGGWRVDCIKNKISTTQRRTRSSSFTSHSHITCKNILSHTNGPQWTKGKVSPAGGQESLHILWDFHKIQNNNNNNDNNNDKKHDAKPFLKQIWKLQSAVSQVTFRSFGFFLLLSPVLQQNYRNWIKTLKPRNKSSRSSFSKAKTKHRATLCSSGESNGNMIPLLKHCEHMQVHGYYITKLFYITVHI